MRLAPVLFCAVMAMAADLGDRVRTTLEGSTASRAHWGMQVVDLESGRILFETNSHLLFTPASNTKLFSTALGLMRLGAEHRFTTRVLAAVEPEAEGVINGDLILVGEGDPNLSNRAIPYRMGLAKGDPLAAIKALAGQIASWGVKRIQGSITGDDTWYVWEPIGDGWAAGDEVWDYGAPPSALSVNDNSFLLKVRPAAKPGDPAAITLDPPLEFYSIDNRVRTVLENEGKFFTDRLPGSSLLRIWGDLPAGGAARSRLLGISDPALYAAMALRAELIGRGIVVRGPAQARHSYPNEFENLEKLADPPSTPAGIELARRESAPLVEDLRITDKVSQNLHAELILRAVGRSRRNIGSRQAGLAELAEFLKEAGVEASEYEFNDGSGLSRTNLVSPAAVVKLLVYLYSTPQRDTWMSLLPVAGEDGTLSSRFKGTAGAGRVRAKTGTLAHVNSLSGYAQTQAGGIVAFSILVNNSVVPGSEVRRAIDAIVNQIIE